MTPTVEQSDLLDDPTKQHFRCGHPKTSDNLRSIGKGKFKCRQCDTERDRQRFANMSTAEKERRNARKRDARRPTPIEALQQRVERLESVETAAIHMRERMIAARNFLAIGSTDDADRHLREGIEYFDIDPDCRAALGERADV